MQKKKKKKKRIYLLERLVKTKETVALPERAVQELVDILQVPKYYSNSSHSKQSLKNIHLPPSGKADLISSQKKNAFF
jgi:hypothetical protein